MKQAQDARAVTVQVVAKGLCVGAFRDFPKPCGRAANIGAVVLSLERHRPDEKQRPRARDLVHYVEQRSGLRFTPRQPDFAAKDGDDGLDRDPIPKAEAARIRGRAPLEAVSDDRADARV
jgi:hypothetical protein